MNALNPDRMPPAERLDEVAAILAAGLVRLRARKSTPILAAYGESPLAIPAGQRRHVWEKNLMDSMR